MAVGKTTAYSAYRWDQQGQEVGVVLLAPVPVLAAITEIGAVKTFCATGGLRRCSGSRFSCSCGRSDHAPNGTTGGRISPLRPKKRRPRRTTASPSAAWNQNRQERAVFGGIGTIWSIASSAVSPIGKNPSADATSTRS